MRKFIEKTIEVSSRDLESVTCNMCSKTVEGDMCDMSDITNIQISFGFGSKYDSDEWDFDLCDNCIEDIVSKFKRPL